MFFPRSPLPGETWSGWCHHGHRQGQEHELNPFAGQKCRGGTNFHFFPVPGMDKAIVKVCRELQWPIRGGILNGGSGAIARYYIASCPADEESPANKVTILRVS